VIVTGEETPILRTVCESVSVPKSLDAAAVLWLNIEDGLGLAAPQVGLDARVFVMRGWPDPFVNPELVDASRECDVMVERCLSLPGVARPVQRSKKIRLRAQRPTGEWRTFKLRGADARVAQHELDHLDGVLIVDY
jgi:peptide deformylase